MILIQLAGLIALCDVAYGTLHWARGTDTEGVLDVMRVLLVATVILFLAGCAVVVVQG